MSNQKANDYIKEAFKKLKLNRQVSEGVQTVKGMEDSYSPLSEVISFHKGRKSFVTLALAKGIPSRIVMALSGHKKDVVFNRYIKFTDDQLAIEMNKLSRSARSLKIAN